MGVPVTIEDPDDVKFAVLGDVAGYNAHEACGRMAKLWSYCTGRQAFVLPEALVRGFLGERGVEAITTSELGEAITGGIRIRGAEGRLEWYAETYLRKESKRAGGKARAAQAARSGGRFVAAGAPSGQHQHSTSSHQQPPADAGHAGADGPEASAVPDDVEPASTSRPPASTSRPPADHQQATSIHQLSDSDLDLPDLRSHTHIRAREGTQLDRHRQALYAVWDVYRLAHQRCNDAIERGQAGGVGVAPVGGGVGADLRDRLRELVAEFDGDYAECERILCWCVQVAATKAIRDMNMRLLALAFEPGDVKAARAETDLAVVAAQRPSSLARGEAKQRRDEELQRERPSRSRLGPISEGIDEAFPDGFLLGGGERS